MIKKNNKFDKNLNKNQRLFGRRMSNLIALLVKCNLLFLFNFIQV